MNDGDLNANTDDAANGGVATDDTATPVANPMGDTTEEAPATDEAPATEVTPEEAPATDEAPAETPAE